MRGDKAGTIIWLLYTSLLIYSLVLIPPSQLSIMERITYLGDPYGRIRHALAFTLEAFLSLSVLGSAGLPFTTGLALFTEVAQAFIPWRSCDLLDFLADLLGILLGSLFYLFLGRLRGKRRGGLGWLYAKVFSVRKEDR